MKRRSADRDAARVAAELERVMAARKSEEKKEEPDERAAEPNE